MKEDKKLKDLDELIESFHRVNAEYPQGGYGRILDKLIQQRTDYVNKIGRKNDK